MVEKSSRKIKAKRNVILGLLNKLVLCVLEFISRYFFIEKLGEELLGINYVFSNVIQLLSLAELGLNNVVSYSFFSPLANDDKHKIASLIKFYRNIYNIIALIICVVGLFIFPFVEVLINTDVEIPHIRIIYLFFLVDTVFSYLFIYKTILLNANQKGYINNIYFIVVNTYRIVLQIISLVLLKNIFIYLGIRVLFNLLSNVLISNRVDKEYPYICNTRDVERINSVEKKDLFNTIKSGFIYKLSALLLNNTDNILVSLLIGTVWVGYIANYDTIYAGIGSFYIILFSSITPSIGNLVETEKSEKRYNVFKVMNFAAAWLAILFSTCFYVLSGEFIAIWIGDKFVLDSGIVFAKSLIIFFSCLMQPIFSFREALGLYKKTKYVMLLAAIINIILSIILGYFYGIKGVLWASIISMITTYCWYEPYLLFKQCFFIKSTSFFIKKVMDVIVLVISFYITELIFKNWNVCSFLSWFFKASIIFIFVNILCFVYNSFFVDFRFFLKSFVKSHRRGF